MAGRRGIRIRGESVERLRAMAKQQLEDTVRMCADLQVDLKTVHQLVEDAWPLAVEDADANM